MLNTTAEKVIEHMAEWKQKLGEMYVPKGDFGLAKVGKNDKGQGKSDVDHTWTMVGKHGKKLSKSVIDISSPQPDTQGHIS